jgi:hypothetical protein
VSDQTEMRRHAVSASMDTLGTVAEDASADDGEWTTAFRDAWVEIDALVAHETAALAAEVARLEARLAAAERVVGAGRAFEVEGGGIIGIGRISFPWEKWTALRAALAEWEGVK